MAESSLRQIDHRILETAVRIFTAWGVTPTQSAAILGWDASSLHYALSSTTPARLTTEQSERLQLTIELIRAVHGLHGHVEREWLHRPDDRFPFQGAPPAEFLGSGRLDALRVTLQTLDDILRGRVPPSREAVALARTLPHPVIDMDEQ